MNHVYPPTGLSSTEVSQQRTLYGQNIIEAEKDRLLLSVLKETALEPMFVLLVATSIIYFALGQYQEGIIMLVAICIVTGISLFQEYRSRNAIASLKKLSAAKATVIRDGRTQQVATEELVVGDILLLEEGELVPADGILKAANDFSLNESILTGESFSV
ncbi:MAG: cation-translocating P-type ATPase, partial [Dinghuibacter sp.]|nr:cation-translocating P-type ATPase [Dinghuibacter sp.]